MGRHRPMVALATVLAMLAVAAPAFAVSADWATRAGTFFEVWYEAARALGERAHRTQPTLAVAILVVGVLLPPLAMVGLVQRWRSGRRARRAIAARVSAESATQLIGRSPGRRAILQLEIAAPVSSGISSGGVARGSDPQMPEAPACFTLDGSRAVVRIGGAEDSEVRLPQPMIARYHAAIRRESDGGFWLVDIERSDAVPVLLNGERIAQSRLVAGDVIEIGPAKLQLVERVA